MTTLTEFRTMCKALVCAIAEGAAADPTACRRTAAREAFMRRFALELAHNVRPSLAVLRDPSGVFAPEWDSAPLWTWSRFLDHAMLMRNLRTGGLVLIAQSYLDITPALVSNFLALPEAHGLAVTSSRALSWWVPGSTTLVAIALPCNLPNLRQCQRRASTRRRGV